MPPSLLALPIRARAGGGATAAAASAASASRIPLLLPPHTRRSFSTTPSLMTKTIALRSLPSLLIPPYPHGDNRHFKQSNWALYGGQRPQTNVIRPGRHSSKHFHKWNINTMYKLFWSHALRAWIRVRLTKRVFRTIRKEKSIDFYVLGEKAARIKELGPAGWKLRWLVLQAVRTRKRLDLQRWKLGLAVEGQTRPKQLDEPEEEPVVLTGLELGDEETSSSPKELAESSRGKLGHGANAPNGAAAAATGEGEEDMTLAPEEISNDAVSMAAAKTQNIIASDDGQPTPVGATASAPGNTAIPPAPPPPLATHKHNPLLTVPPVPAKPGILRVAMDYATPGKITRISQNLMARHLGRVRGMEEFGINIKSGTTRRLHKDKGLGRAGSRLKAIRAETASPSKIIAAGQALQIRDMAAKVVRRNKAVRSSAVTRYFKKKYSGRRV